MLAYELALKPDEFEELQPIELYKMLEARDNKRRFIDGRLSFYTCQLMAPHLARGSTINPKKLYEELWGKDVPEAETKAKDLSILKEEFDLCQK